ncbi:MAG TPA: ABC transporter ATP-binding protein [Candidatus Paceibacterota bacterium]|nr:ABC transporter ATP-binding protein [Candidatus Paceibacterota bacterium]
MKRMYKKARHREETYSTKTQVLKEYWKAIQPYKAVGFFIVALLVIPSIMAIFIPILYKHFFDLLTGSATRAETAPLLVQTILYILILNGILWAAYRAATFLASGFQAKVMAKLKENSFDYILGHSYTFFANRFTGSIIQRINRFSRSFEVLTDRLFWNVIPLFIRIVGMVIVVWLIEPAIALIIIALVFSFLIFNYFFARWKMKYDIERAEAESFSTAVLSDAVTNHTTIQLFNGEKSESNYFKEVADDQARVTAFTWNLNGATDAVQSGLITLAEFSLFYFSIGYWQSGIFTIGTFVLIQSYLIGLSGQLWDFSRVIRDFYQSFADAKELVDMVILPKDIVDAPGAKPLEIKNGSINFENVSFNFNETRKILDKFNLSIPGGQKVAFVGPSGSGKSTIVRLIMRLYDVSGGKISLDGQDIRHVKLASLRNSVAFVPQDPILFHRTLLENIRYGRPDSSDEEVKRAAELAHCNEFIKGLPQGYETYVGERGIKLSGGERQRIAIARAMLKGAPILILDEATSSLDSHSESLVQDALDKLMKGKTAIVVAHRLSTIRKMDRIVVIANGVIREEGTHEKLSKKEGGLYSKLWALQAGGFLADRV